MLNRVSTSAKLYMLIFITAISLIGLGLYGVNDFKKMNENTRTLFSDRVVCMQQLANVRFEYISEIFPMARYAQSHAVTFSDAEDRIVKAEEISNKNWHDYLQSYLTPEEAVLAKQVDLLKNQADEASQNVKSLLSKRDTAALKALVQKEPFIQPAPLVIKITQLMELQVRVGRQIFNNNKEIYQDTSKEFILLILISLSIALSLSFIIIKNIKDLIGDILNRNKIIVESEGKYRKVNARFEAIVDNIFAGIALTDLNGNNFYCSLRMQAVKGWTEEEINQHQLKYIHPEDVEVVSNAQMEAMANPGKFIDVVYRFFHKDGNYIWLESLVSNKLSDPDLSAIVVFTRDITDRKTGDELILKEKELSETIINSLPGVFYLQSTKGEYLLWNKNFETVTGYTKEEVAKLRTEDLIVAEDLERVSDTIKKLFTDGYATVEANAKTKDGTIIPFLLTGSPIMYENQLCLLGTGIDISSRIKAEEELRSSEQKYKLLFESNPVPLTMIAKDDLSIIAVNEAAAHLYGYTRDEFLHSSVSIVRLKEDLEAQRRLFRTAVTSPTEREVTRHVKKDGTIFFVQTNVNDIIYNGRPVRLVMSNDVTEKLKAEELLKKSEANLKAIMDTTDTAYALLDKELNVVAFNQMAVKFVNNQFQHNPVQGDKFADYFPKERFSQFLSYSNQVLMGANINYEANYPQNDGSVLWYDVRLFPITNKQNEIFGLMISLSDVTERKKSEIHLAELNEDLQKHIKELAISNAELEQFAYVASHDLQEPLRMVTSFMTQLEKKYGDVVDDKGRQYIHFAVDGAKRMRQIILDLLDFSRVGRTEDDQEKVDFNKVVNEVLALYRRQIEEIRAEVAFDNLPVIHTYKTPLRQVFQNLIGNSLKYHSAEKAPVIKISCKETKAYFQFSIKDNGIGISPEYFDKIFIIFQRLHNKDEYSGTGMGLAITKKIIEGLGGKIWVESSVEKGSTFYFTILKKDKS
jgi:PAS domain S-box-containing protein